VPVNCAALPENIVEAELFGYRRGAFSGATDDQQGLVRAAEGGTLFLDEIGDLRRGVQGVLLRTLQDREVRPLGGLKTVRVDVRFVAATNRDLDDETEFRADLLARLSGYSFTLPPLRARRADLGILVAAILARRVGPAPPAFTTAAARRLFWHDWPHNIRELEQAVTTACKLAAERGDAVGVADLPAAVRDAQPPSAPDARDDERREELCAALEQHAGNVTRTAESLGITRMQVHRLARRYGIDLAAFRRG
jgi:transcriptional regulator with GAF, ATPase, and Fis domain